jgi:hypothetical protein
MRFSKMIIVPFPLDGQAEDKKSLSEQMMLPRDEKLHLCETCSASHREPCLTDILSSAIKSKRFAERFTLARLRV